uniref:Uncharacterized protein n=1 Tax=Renouxia sp. TaxID=2485823 RepID=A0A3G3MH98_9FLOR|nr:hypothetical protein [Renouxia sp.]
MKIFYSAIFIRLGEPGMIKCFTFLISLLNPFSFIRPYAFVRPHMSKPIVDMAPMSHGISKATRITNAMNNMGYSSMATRTMKEDGTVVTREKLIYTKEVVEQPSGKVVQKPSASSSKSQGKVTQSFFEDSDEVHRKTQKRNEAYLS